MPKQVKKIIAIAVVVYLVFLNPKKQCNHSTNAGNIKSFGNLPAHLYNVNDFSPSEFITFSDSTQNKLEGIDTIVTWKMLRNVRYIEKPHPEYEVVYQPVYGKSLKELEGKIILVKGYIIPIDKNIYALSKNVFAACFFCGQAGPETVMGIKFKTKPGRLKTDTYVTLKGKFKLNHNNPDDWMYHILNAEIIEIKP